MTDEKKKKRGLFSGLMEKLDKKMVKESEKCCCCCADKEEAGKEKGCC